MGMRAKATTTTALASDLTYIFWPADLSCHLREVGQPRELSHPWTEHDGVLLDVQEYLAVVVVGLFESSRRTVVRDGGAVADDVLPSFFVIDATYTSP